MATAVEEHVDTHGGRPANVPNKGLVLFVVKASPTSAVNSVKLVMLLEELGVPHEVVVLNNPGIEGWFKQINPLGLIPALEDDVRTAAGISTQRVNVFESSSCMTFLADKYDTENVFCGRDLHERTIVGNWMALHTASLGPTAKWWLWFKVKSPNTIGNTLDLLAKAIRDQYDILERRLSEPSQEYVALLDRATIADFVNLPFANAQIASTAGFDFRDWPNLSTWSEKMLARPAVKRAMARVQMFGVEEDQVNGTPSDSH
ncbi:glutathione S-transferase [Viridothelium virens]|uniref:glutathione transferase n=1 Tax=Viridothelium virens TaxID=1048519 RepID=A0A6A6HBL2_VIRVR|nr:glutathione S-transferase [Viridothelium virens]